MMDDRTLNSLNQRREQICEEIASIETMRKGSFCEWYHSQTLKNGTVRQRGPFYKITSKGSKNKTISLTVPKDKKEQMQAEVENYRRFRKLADEYVDVCEQISILSEREKPANM
jgi:hypothetical protein